MDRSPCPHGAVGYGCGRSPMSEHEALARFHYGCAARHHKSPDTPALAFPLGDARTTITFDERLNQDPALAAKQDRYFGTGR